jgi:hypothetical protein
MSALRSAIEALGRPKVGLTAVLIFSSVLFLLFCAVDQRPPDDHDDFYTANSSWALQDFRDAGLVGKPGVLWDHFQRGELHPRLSQTFLVATMGTFGPSRFVYRASNLPFLLLLLVGTYLVARELAGVRLALVAAFVVGNLPMVINYSRKWDIQFHAAALTPLGIWLALAACRSEGARATRLWVFFGLWQGLRLYTHPIIVPDVLVTLAVVGLLLKPHASATGQPFGRHLRRYLASLAACFAAALYYTGLARGVLGEPEFSLRRYLSQRGSYSETGWWIDSDVLAKLNHLHELLAEVIWLDLMPLASILLLPGLLLLPIVLLRRRLWGDQPPGTRWLAVLVLLPCLAQVPPVALGTSNRAFLNDWLFLVPGLVVLSLLALRRAALWFGPREPFWVQVGVAALILVSVLHHAVPLGARAFGPDPIDDHEAWDNLVLGPFVRSSSGRAYTTHHVPTRYRFAGSALASAVADLAGGPAGQEARFVLLDLAWDPSIEGRRGCRLGDPGSVRTWSWAPPSYLNVWAREVSPWPFVFEGFSGMRSVRPDHEVDVQASSWAVFRPRGTVELHSAVKDGGEVTLPVLGGDEERASGTAEEAPQVELEEPATNSPEEEDIIQDPLPRIAVVRLWVVMAPFWERETYPCKPDERLPEGFFAAAGQRMVERFPDARPLGTLPDPTGWLLGRAVEWDRTRSYGGTALIFDLGESPSESGSSANQLESELNGDLPGHDRHAPGVGEHDQPIEPAGQ